MKLEHLEDISGGRKHGDVISNNLIRHYDFDCIEVQTLQQLIQLNILEEKGNLDLSEVNFTEGINYKLILKISDSNSGITFVKKDQFKCLMNIDSYNHMVLIMQPFVENDLDGFNWLDEQIDKLRVKLIFFFLQMEDGKIYRQFTYTSKSSKHPFHLTFIISTICVFYMKLNTFPIIINANYPQNWSKRPH